MYLSELAIGSTVFIDVKRNTEEYTFVTKVQGLKETGVYTDVPTNKGRPFGFRPGDEVSIRIAEDGKLYKWCIEEWETHNMAMLTFIHFINDKSGEIYNRRKSYRVFVGVDTRAYRAEEEKEDITVVDISTTGIGFLSDAEYNVGDTLHVPLTDIGHHLSLEVAIVRKEHNRVAKYSYGAEILTELREVGKYAAAKQREQIQKSRNSRR